MLGATPTISNRSWNMLCLRVWACQICFSQHSTQAHRCNPSAKAYSVYANGWTSVRCSNALCIHRLKKQFRMWQKWYFNAGYYDVIRMCIAETCARSWPLVRWTLVLNWIFQRLRIAFLQNLSLLSLCSFVHVQSSLCCTCGAVMIELSLMCTWKGFVTHSHETSAVFFCRTVCYCYFYFSTHECGVNCWGYAYVYAG